VHDRIQASTLEVVSLITSESSGTMFLVMITESTGTVRTDKSKRQLELGFR
jgi:hypothetical protein